MDPLDDWDFHLPPERIARRPAERRSASRLMHLPLAGGAPRHLRFSELPSLLRPGDLVVANDTRVMPSRLRGRRASGGRVELLVLSVGEGPARALARPARKLAEGDVIHLDGGGAVRIVGAPVDGVVAVHSDAPWEALLEAEGAMPLPPYLEREADDADRERYQTVFAGPLGSAAAPTAGLHFDGPVLDALAAGGVGFATVTLHVGLGTFLPLREEQLRTGRLHEEWYRISEETAARVAATRGAGGRVIAVGTTSIRTLESATPPGATAPIPGAARTDLFLRPPARVRAADGLITNFHLPRSSLLMLVACLVGRERLLAAYAEAVAHEYRFYSYGDAMLLL